MLGAFEGERFDVVIDMCAFSPDASQAAADLTRQVGAKQHIFCSTVCTYGVKVPPGVLVDETFPQEPISGYGRGKVECEQLLLACDAKGDFATTIIRPSCTYGEGGTLIDNLEFDPPTWSRILEGKPILMAGDGLGLWNATHRDDCGKAFAAACLNETSYGEAYNATVDRVFTWNDYIREAAAALGQPAQVLYMPRTWIVGHDAKRFNLIDEISGFHGAYTSAKAKRDLGFHCDITFAEGSARTLNHLRSKDTLKPADDALIDDLCAKAVAAGVEAVTL
ncbi:MAG: NAD-dependent epimerase/dehydratase family protein [Planctomycetota bacterium]